MSDQVQQPVYESDDGRWSVPRLLVLGAVALGVALTIIYVISG